MPITIKKPTGGKLANGRDHLLKCQLTWDDETHPDFTDSDVHLYVTMKANDAADDEDAVIAFNSEDNPDQFIYNATGWTGDGKVKIWFKKEDQDSIVPDTVKDCMDVVCIDADGKEFPFILDYNIVWGQSVTQETGHVAI